MAGDTVPVAGAELSLLDAGGVPVARVHADDRGAFRLPAPGPGSFHVQASRIGFATISAEVALGAEESTEVELRMAEEAVPLEPIVVVGRRRIRPGTLEEFYDRMARMQQVGKGQFLTREQIADRESMPLPFLLQTLPGVWTDTPSGGVKLVSSGSGGMFCTPEFVLDGQPMLGGYRELQTMDLEGVEVYRGYSEAVEGHPNRCGTVFLWRRADWGNPMSFGGAVLAAGLGALSLLIFTLF